MRTGSSTARHQVLPRFSDSSLAERRLGGTSHWQLFGTNLQLKASAVLFITPGRCSTTDGSALYGHPCVRARPSVIPGLGRDRSGTSPKGHTHAVHPRGGTPAVRCANYGHPCFRARPSVIPMLGRDRDRRHLDRAMFESWLNRLPSIELECDWQMRVVPAVSVAAMFQLPMG